MKGIKLLVFFTMAFFYGINSVFAQEPQPKAGSYYCYTTAIETSISQINRIQVVPAFFGNISLDGQGNYKFTKRSGSGKYVFDKEFSQLVFTTGDLKIMRVSSYKSDNFFLNYNGLSFHCTTGKVNTAAGSSDNKNNPNTAAKPGLPFNKGLSGKLLTTVSDANNGFIAKVFEFDLAKGSFSIIFPNGIAAQNSKGEIFHIDQASRMKISDRTGNVTVKQLTDNINYYQSEKYPAISNSGENLALATGSSVLITDRNLRKVAEFAGYTQPAWTPDGGVVVAGDGKSKQGLFVIDSGFRNVKKLIQGYDYAQMPAVSSDGKSIAFVNKGEIWTVNSDGTEPRAALINSEATFPAWSPDGKYIAAIVKETKSSPVERKLIAVIDIKADVAFFIVDSSNQNVSAGNRITWLP
jgi:WD40-like Beta Propeller Repeat